MRNFEWAWHFIKESPESFLAPSTKWRENEKSVTQKRALIWPGWCPGLRLPASRMVRNMFLVFINDPVCGFCYSSSKRLRRTPKLWGHDWKTTWRGSTKNHTPVQKHSPTTLLSTAIYSFFNSLIQQIFMMNLFTHSANLTLPGIWGYKSNQGIDIVFLLFSLVGNMD